MFIVYFFDEKIKYYKLLKTTFNESEIWKIERFKLSCVKSVKFSKRFEG